MAQLPRCATPAQDLPLFDDRATNAGANRQHDHIRGPFRGTASHLAQQSHGRIVFDDHRQACGGLHLGRKIKTAQVNIAAGHDGATGGDDLSGDANANAPNLRPVDQSNQRKAAVQHHRRISRTLCRTPGQNGACGIDPGGPDMRAANVDADRVHVQTQYLEITACNSRRRGKAMVSSRCLVTARSSEMQSFHKDRPAITPDAPAAIAVSTCPRNVA